MSLEGLSAEEISSLAGLMKSLGENPKTRIGLQALIKTAHPETATPELDNAMAMRAIKQESDHTKAEFEAYKAEQTAEKAELKKWAEAVGAGHCTYDDIAAIREFMNTNGIFDPVNGAALWKQTNQIAAPSNAPTNVFEMPSDTIDKWKKGGVAGLNRVALSEGHQMMADIRAGKLKVV